VKAAAASLASDEQARRVLGHILERSEYAGRRIDDEAWLAFGERIRAWLDGFQGWMVDLSATAPFLYWTILVGLLLVALALIAHIVFSVRVALRASRPEEPEPFAAPRERDLVAEAAALAETGRYLDAARTMQLACLELLLRSGAIRLARGEANRRLRHELAAAPIPEAQRRSLGELLARLERQVFRDREEDRGLYEGWRTLHGGLRAGVRSA
jgi:hypothetical protein